MSARRRDAVLFAVALAVRVAHLLAVREGPLFRYLLIDSAWYDAVGRRLAAGDGFPDGPFFMNVLPGAVLGAVYAVFGSGDGGRLAALAIQVVLGAASVPLLARLGDALGRPRAGLAAAGALAVLGPAIFYDAALLTPSLLLFLTTLLLLVAARDHDHGKARAVGLGVLTGLLVLGRANHLLWLPVLVVPRLARGRSGLAPAALLVGATVAVVAPATLHNVRASGELVPVTANGGMASWAGNHPGATGIYSQPAFLTNPVPEREAEDYRLEASRRTGRPLTLAQSSAYWTGETLRRWRDEPGPMLRLTARKLWLFFHATESQTNLSYYFAIDESPVLALLRLHLGWILPFALVGLALDARRLPLPAAAVGIALVTCLAFYVSSEYRHPVVPALLLFAATGAGHVRDAWRGGGAGRRVAIAAGIAALFLVTNLRDPMLDRLQSRRVDTLNFATLALQAGDVAEAERFLDRCLAIDPAWPPARRKMAEVQARLGRPEAAAEQARLADRLEGAPPDAATAALRAAETLFRAGRFEEAQAAFLALATGAGPGGPDGVPAAVALNDAGLCAMNLGRWAEADSLLREAIARDPAYASPVIHRGRLALAAGDSTTAAARAREALELAPSDARARRLLARATGSPDGDDGGEETDGPR